MKVKPLYDYLVVDTEDKKETTKSGFILPSAESKYTTAKVVAAGNGGRLYGNEVEVVVKAGDTVLFPADSAMKVKVNGEEITVIRQSDVIAVIE